MRTRTRAALVAAVGLTLGTLARAGAGAGQGPLPKHELPAAAQGGTVVGMCDGKTSVEVPDLKPGEEMSRQRAQQVADELMQRWRETNPDAAWDRLAMADQAAAATGRAAGVATVPPTEMPVAGEQYGTYTDFTQRDVTVWALETDRFVAAGKGVFHDAKKLGGTIGVSCDMCHPDAANTHPETYPKYQVQLQRVALLRDMINWCIENPVKGVPLEDGDPRLRALEAYIIAQRKGVKLDYGRH